MEANFCCCRDLNPSTQNAEPLYYYTLQLIVSLTFYCCSLVQILPPSHQIFLRYLMCILHRISLHSDHNGMTSSSLSICISPSLLWPRSSSGAALSQVNDAKKLNAVVEQMIECVDEVFGPDCLHLFDHLIPEWKQSQEVNANVIQGANLSLEIGQRNNYSI